MIFGVIVAGGVGARLGADMPKQFLDLAGTPIIVHTLKAFLACEGLEHIYLGTHQEWLDYTETLILHGISEKAQERIHLVPGGRDRNETIMNVIEQIEQDFGTDEIHYIITQDGVRPFVSQRIIRDHIGAVAEYGAVDTAIPAVDTMVVSEDGRFIDDIPDRRFLYQSQTPQSFRMDLLKTLYMSLSREEKAALTDACKICTVRGVPVHIVEGDASNMKITTLHDLEIARMMAESHRLDMENS